MSIAAAAGGDNEKDKGEFRVRPVNEYAHRQTSEKVTVAVEPFITDAEAAEAFGKLNPYRLGILPILIVIQNDGPDAIRIEGAKGSLYQLPDNSKIEATPAQDVKFLRRHSDAEGNPRTGGRREDPKAAEEPARRMGNRRTIARREGHPGGTVREVALSTFRAPVASAAGVRVYFGHDEPGDR